jgi:hypothetical protein
MEYEYPDPDLLVKLRELGVPNAQHVFYELRALILKECRLWEGPYGDYLLMDPFMVGADK